MDLEVIIEIKSIINHLLYIYMLLFIIRKELKCFAQSSDNNEYEQLESYCNSICINDGYTLEESCKLYIVYYYYDYLYIRKLNNIMMNYIKNKLRLLIINCI